MPALVKEIEAAGIRPLELIRALEEPRLLRPAADARDRAVIAEAEFTAQRLGIHARDLWKQLSVEPHVAGGSFLTGTNVELLYASVGAATTLATFTTEDNLQKTLPHVIIPAGFFLNSLSVGKSLRVRARGRLGSTGTPTFTYTARLLTSTTWSAGGVGVSSAAITVGSGVTLAPWVLELDITCRSVGAGGGANTTLAILGDVRAGTAFAAAGGTYSIPAANTAFTVAIDHAATQYFYLSAACGTSNAANLITLEMLKVYGEN